MKLRVLKLIILSFIVFVCVPAYSQVGMVSSSFPQELADSLRKAGIIIKDQRKSPSILLTTEQALRFIRDHLQPNYWKNANDPFRTALGQLVFEASHEPFDSAAALLSKYPFDSLRVPWDKFYTWEPLNIRIPVTHQLQTGLPVDTVAGNDTLRTRIIGENQMPGLKDTAILVVVDTLHQVGSAYRDFPFTYYEFPFQADSLVSSVNILLGYLQARDSSIVNISGLGGESIPVWINSRAGMMQRYWLRNDLDDSVTLWIGATSRNTLSMFLEKGISFRRPVMQGNYSEARIDVREVDKSKLLDVKKITVKPEYWKYRSEAVFALNQAALSNWVKGGESSISTSMDITGFADYTNKALKISSNNFARLKYGLIKSGDEEVKKNLDLLETNSKLNHKAFGKFDFSAILLFKTQLARGFTYPTDTTRILVSKFLNPAVLTIGFGLDYKPNKTTSINFSPLSYKGTFVTDTTGTVGVDAIDPGKYGIPKGRKSLNEPGVSFLITNEFRPIKTMTVTNRLQLFTNYINHPQNVDIDWEMIVTATLNWFTEVRLNTHLIYDDDTRTTVLGKDRKPVMIDGKPYKTARTQFKELLGFSFIFRF